MNVITIINIFSLIFVIVSSIYYAVKIADLKNRSKVRWAGYTLLGSYPALILLSLLPPLWSEDEKESYSKKITSKYDKIGYILISLFTILLIFIFFSNYNIELTLKELPLVPGGPRINLLDITTWMNTHPLFRIMTVLVTFVIFMLSIIRILKKDLLFPKAILNIQLFALAIYMTCVIFSVLWAFTSWGSFWGWDLKETGILFILVMIGGVHTYFIRSLPSKKMTMTVSLFQFAVIIYVIWGMKSFYYY